MKDLNTIKKPAAKDWHNADIKAALEKKGYTLAKLSKKHGYCRMAASNTLHKPWPKMERIIAATIGKEPWEIWPSRYDSHCKPNRAMGRPALSVSHNNIEVCKRNGKNRRVILP